MKRLAFALLLATPMMAQNVTPPQINLTGNIGTVGFPLLNSGTFQMPTDADFTLLGTNVNTSAISIKITSAVALTATRNIIYPTGGFLLNVENSTTGGQNIIIKGATGTGVTVGNGLAISMWFDGTNYISFGLASTSTQISTTIVASATNCASLGFAYLPASNTCGGVIFTAPTANQAIASGAFNLSLTGASTAPGSLFIPTYRADYNGKDLGSGSTNGGNWSVNKLMPLSFATSVQGIKQMIGAQFTTNSPGDSAFIYDYGGHYGGSKAANDESVTEVAIQTHQIGYMSGTITSGGMTGSNLLVATIGCHGGYCATPIGYSQLQYPQGVQLLDTTQVGSSAVVATSGTANGGQYFTFSSGSYPTSYAGGVIIPASCTPNNQDGVTPIATTCNVTLNAGSADFSTSAGDLQITGQFEGQFQLTAAPASSGGVQSITFLSNYYWNGIPAQVMQDQAGRSGMAFTVTGASWPIAYHVIGATSDGKVYFSDCAFGVCNGSSGVTGPNVTPTTIAVGSGGNTISRDGAGNVTFTAPNGGLSLQAFQTGNTVIVTGATPSDLNGTFTIASNTNDSFNAAMTWAQTGGAETSTGGGLISSPPVSVTFYPAAFTTGSNGGISGNVSLARNTVPFVNTDAVLAAPASVYEQKAIEEYHGQTSPASNAYASGGFTAHDVGPQYGTYMVGAIQTGSNPLGSSYDFFSTGSYRAQAYFNLRPASNGCVICEQGNETSGSSPRQYSIFRDYGSTGYGTQFNYDPATGNYYFIAQTTPTSTVTVNNLSMLHVTNSNAPLCQPSGGVIVNVGCGVGYSFTSTSATSDNLTVSGMTSSGHCQLTATNASAATNVTSTYISAKTTGQITITHATTAGMTYDVNCTPN